eukprot:Awhi_evm1s8883
MFRKRATIGEKIHLTDSSTTTTSSDESEDFSRRAIISKLFKNNVIMICLTLIDNDDFSGLSTAKELENNTTLKYVHLDCEWSAMSCAKNLKNALMNNTTVEHVSLVGLFLFMNDGGIETISDLLLFNKTITAINLSGNCFNEEDGKKLGQVLELNTTLKTLTLCHCTISSQAFAEVSLGLRCNTALKVLHLGYSKIDDVCVTSLCNGLKKNASLENLYLNDNCISDFGVEELSK